MKEKIEFFTLVVAVVLVNIFLTPWYSGLHRMVQLAIVLGMGSLIAGIIIVLMTRLYVRKQKQ